MELSPYIPPVHIHQKYLHHHDRCWLDIIFQPGGNFQKNKWPFRIVRIKKNLGYMKKSWSGPVITWLCAALEIVMHTHVTNFCSLLPAH